MQNLVCSPTITTIGDVLCKAGSLLKLVIPVLIALGVVYFIWGVISYVINDDEEAKQKGKDRIIYGLIGFVVIFAMWGLVNIVITTFGFDQGNALVSNFIENTATQGGNTSSTCALGNNPKLGDLFGYATCFIYRSVVPLIIALAIAMFIWGVVQYVINSDDQEKKEKGRQFMVWGIIGLTVMFGVWGIVRIVGDTFNITKAIPQLHQ